MKKRKFLLVSPMLDFGPFLPLNVSVIIAVLEKAGYEVKLFDTTFYKFPEKSSGAQDIYAQIGIFKPVNWDGYGMDDLKEDYIGDFQRLIRTFEPDFIGVSVFTTFNERLAMELIDAIDDSYQGEVVVGGIHTHINLDRVKQNKRITAIVSGEADQMLVDALEFLSARKPGEKCDLPAFHYRDENYQWVDTNAAGITNIETIPFLSWDHFDDRNFYRPFDGRIIRMGHVEMARGCPFRCTYCINEYFHEKYPNSKPYQRDTTESPSMRGYWRLKSVERFLEEVDYLKNRYKLNAVKIWDDDFLAMNIETLAGVCAGMNKMGLKFLCHSRPEHVNDEKVRILAENGCLQIGIGVESGNPEYRDKVLGRKMSDQQIIDAFRNCRKHNIIASGYCMIGMPDETREDILMTARLLRKAGPHVVVHSIFTPYEGNSLADYAKMKGYIDEDIDYEDMLRCQMTMPSISKEEVERLFKTFVLYCRFDDSIYPKVWQAEEDDELFRELIDEMARQARAGLKLDTRSGLADVGLARGVHEAG